MSGKLRIVVDSNTLFSAFLYDGVPQECIDYIAQNHILIVPEYCLIETTRVIQRKRPDKAKEWDLFLTTFDPFVVYKDQADPFMSEIPPIRDEKDEPVLAAAMSIKADIIITRDKDFFTPEIQSVFDVYKAGDFLMLFAHD